MDIMTPYMATTSQKMMEMRFLVRMRGALTPPPMMEEPVMKMPLLAGESWLACVVLLWGFNDGEWWEGRYHAAPTTERPMQRPIPRLAHAYGDTVSRNRPT